MNGNKEKALAMIKHALFVDRRVESLEYWLAFADGAGIGFVAEGGKSSFDLFHWLHAYRTMNAATRVLERDLNQIEQHHTEEVVPYYLR